MTMPPNLLSGDNTSTKQRKLNERKKRNDILDSLLVDSKNRSLDPIEELGTHLALYIGNENDAVDQEIHEPKQRGAQKDILNSPVYQRMLSSVDKKIQSYSSPKVHSEYLRKEVKSRKKEEEDNKKKNIVYKNHLNLSPLRMLTEHRRKLLLRSMCGFDDVDEKRDVATIGIENSFNLRECEIPILPEEKIAAHMTSKVHSNDTRDDTPLASIPDKEMKFVPEWDHYDVMRHRWISLQPATKRLVQNVEDYIPLSSAHNSVPVDSMDHPIQGRFLDSIHFDRTIHSIEQSKASRGNMSLTRGSEASRGLSTAVGGRPLSLMSVNAYSSHGSYSYSCNSNRNSNSNSNSK